MQFQSLRLQDIRSYGFFETRLAPGITVIVGPNGSGKTNLLEAVYVLAHGSSFRGRDRDLVAHNKTDGAIKAVMDDLSERRLSLTLQDEHRMSKEFIIAGTKKQRLSFSQRLPVVLFDPDGLRALSGSPQRRRDFLDSILTRLTPQYGTTLHRFERSLVQRNELLKRQSSLLEDSWRDQLFVWDVKLADLAEQLVDARQNLLDHYNERISDTYSKLANSPTKIGVNYKTFGFHSGAYRQTYFAKLQHLVEHDSLRGFTSIGPHRDDFEVLIDSYPAIEVASRGEMRTIMLAFKLIETDQIKDAHSTSPLLLLDDVFSELDATRRRKLVETTTGCQTIITTTDADVVDQKISHQTIFTKESNRLS